MIVTPSGEGQSYVAALHHGCEAKRVQGGEVSPVTSFLMGISNFAPGGGADWDATNAEKVYLVLEGEITVETENETVTLHERDSVFLASNERRRIVNESDASCVLAVVIAPSA